MSQGGAGAGGGGATTAPDAGTLRCPGCGAPASPDADACAFCRARLKLAACPSCLGRVFVGYEHCPRCGARASRDVQGESTLACPRCRTTMTVVRLDAHELDECPGCGGVWLSGDEFERLCADRAAQARVLHGAWHVAPAGAAMARGAARPPDTVRYLPCPACGAFMNRTNFARVSGVILDVCRAHGTFFDADELAAVVRFVHEGGLDRARRHAEERLKEQERRLRREEQALARERGAAGFQAQRHNTLLTFRDLVHFLSER